MNSICKSFVTYITQSAPRHNKQTVIDDAREKFSLIQDRKVYHNEHFAVRFSYSKGASESFSNTILSLSALEKYDRVPFFVVLVRQQGDNLIFLANTTFLKKISHSSQELSMTNIRGSFNGSDIIRKYNDVLTNSPEHFDDLFAIHQGLDWEDNLLRLVDATAHIKPVNQKFDPTEAERKNIFRSVEKAASFIASPNFQQLEKDLDERCRKCQNEIFIASHIENTNIRGRLIESLITANDDERQKLISSMKELEMSLPAYDTKNGLGDYFVSFDNGDTYTDIKTKIIYLHSNPKAYNIDKFLQQMSDGKSIFLFYFVGVDEHAIFKTLLCSVYHQKLVDNTILQFHWSGRSTRGVAQFNGAAIDEILREPSFQNHIEESQCRQFLTQLLER
jgi:hypothetical protein